MTTKRGKVYRRPKMGFEDLDPDNWHDHAICNAYDRAISGTSVNSHESGEKISGKLKMSPTIHKADSMRPKNMMNKAPGDNSKQNVVWSRSASAHEGKKTQGKKEFKAPRSAPEDDNISWKAGDKCVALYTEDGLYYDCEIISTDKSAGTCIVEYDGYGNKETVEFRNVYSPDRWNKLRSNHEEDSMADANQNTKSQSTSSYTSSSTMSSSTEGTCSDVTQDIYAGRSSKKKKSEEKRKGRPHHNGYPFDSLRGSAPPDFNINPLFGMPPPPPFMAPGFTPHMLARDSHSPKLADLSDDALSSMLMSWYMAGYHTGFYQGISSNNTRKNKRR